MIEGWAHLEAIVHVDRVGPMVGVQMRLDHGWWMGPWVMVQYSIHVITNYYLVPYNVIPLFDHPVILMSPIHVVPVI